MYSILTTIFTTSMLSMMLFSKNIISLLISMEFMMVMLFLNILIYFSIESTLEILLFMTMIVGESILGLILMLMKVFLTSSDLLNSSNVI